MAEESKGDPAPLPPLPTSAAPLLWHCKFCTYVRLCMRWRGVRDRCCRFRPAFLKAV